MKLWKTLDTSQQAKYRQLDNERLEKSRKKFIEKYLSDGEFEEKYDSDFEKVIEHVAQLFKVGCPQKASFLYRVCNTKCKIFSKSLLIFPTDFVKILQLALPKR